MLTGVTVCDDPVAHRTSSRNHDPSPKGTPDGRQITSPAPIEAVGKDAQGEADREEGETGHQADGLVTARRSQEDIAEDIELTLQRRRLLLAADRKPAGGTTP